MTVLKLAPALKDAIWGGHKLHELYGKGNGERIAESWEVSVHPDGLSRCNGGTLCDFLHANTNAVNANTNELPILIKYIDATLNLSVQVHPDDDYARRVEQDNGKTEMWYVIDAQEGAGIYCGFKRDTGRDEFVAMVDSGEVQNLLNFVPVQRGDCFLIEAGTVHAIGAGCVICEVQQSSNVTYRVYDYNRRDASGKMRPLHLDKALDVINYRAFVNNTNSGTFEAVSGGKIRLLTACKHFICRELLLQGQYGETVSTSFTALNVIEGSGNVSGQPFVAGDSFFVPFGERFTLNGTAKIILTTT